jgi:5-methylthioadenosine/S-adenosylhomocysteine deaminase
VALPASQLAIAEMLRFGTVSFTDMYYFDEARIEAITQSGIKANICSGIVVFDPEQRYEHMPIKEQAASLVQQYHNALDGRLRIDLNIHSEYLSNPYVVRAVGEQAVQLGVQTHIHLSETRAEHEECRQRRGGLTPAAYFDSLDFFKQPCTAAHCVYTEPDDWDILAARGVTAVPCVASNAKLASGFAPLPQLVAAGVNVALGTDGVASNNNHNLFKELYMTATVYKGAALDPTVVSPQQTLAAATINGARSQGRAACGAIQVGNRADLVVIDTSIPWMQPTHDTLNNLVFSAQGTDVVLTMVDGEVLYANGEWKTIDVERAVAGTQQAASAIVAAL